MGRPILIFDVDNTLYPRSSGLGRAMGDRIVTWVEQHIDLSTVNAQHLPSGAEIDASQAYNHPTDIDATDELVERLCLHYYKQFGLTIVGLVKNQGVGPELEQSYLDEVHEPSQRLETFMPHKHEHTSTVDLLTRFRNQHQMPLFLFSNAHQDHVDRILEHIGLPMDLFDGCLEYYAMRADCKPNPGSYHMMWNMITSKHPNALPQDCIFFDDAKVNLKAAKDFGFKTVLVHGGYEADHPVPEFVDAVVDDVRNTSEMEEIVQRLGGSSL